MGGVNTTRVGSTLQGWGQHYRGGVNTTGAGSTLHGWGSEVVLVGTG